MKATPTHFSHLVEMIRLVENDDTSTHFSYLVEMIRLVEEKKMYCFVSFFIDKNSIVKKMAPKKTDKLAYNRSDYV